MAAKRENLITDWSVVKIREALPGQSYVIEYGVLEHVEASGRARCKACGQKIAKGEPCLRFAWDFRGCGSWTAQTVHMHAAACPAAKGA